MSQLEPRKYSDRLGVLTPAQLQAALDRFDLGELRAAEPTEGGLFGQNVFVDSTRGRFLLRGSPHTPWQLAQECWFAEQIHTRTRIPAPWPYQIEASAELFGWPFAIMPRLPGETPQALWPGLELGERRDVAAAMGAALAELQALDAEGFGSWDPELGAIRFSERSFADWQIARVLAVLENACATPDVLSVEDVAWAERVISESQAALVDPPTPRFLHTDYAAGNVVVTRDAGWRVSGVFDLQEACFGDPEEDLSRAISSFGIRDLEAGRRFLDAYRRARPLRPGHALRFRLHMLRDRLVLWEYGRRNGIWFEAEARFRDFAERFFELDVF